jgi:hypothetical protein
MVVTPPFSDERASLMLLSNFSAIEARPRTEFLLSEFCFTPEASASSSFLLIVEVVEVVEGISPKEALVGDFSIV